MHSEIQIYSLCLVLADWLNEDLEIYYVAALVKLHVSTCNVDGLINSELHVEVLGSQGRDEDVRSCGLVGTNLLHSPSEMN